MTSPGYPSLYDSSDQRQPPLKPGEELAGKYRMESVLGAGAMGVVVRAWHIELEQPVAVKFLYPEFARNADGAERFRREARAAAKIKNQHVARVLDVGTLEDRNVPYIVMEYLEGCDLSHELQERGPLPVGVAVNYVMQACEAVAEAHERGIVHRDLKPANLFLTAGAHGERMIKVLDFGISKVNGGAQQFSLTDTATLMGSPAYMSPEQLESSRNVDGRADIWSLGVILHELILGRVPFHGESVPQLVRSILSGTRDTLLDLDAGLLALEGVVARCLSQERDQRFESVTALREALRPFAESSSSSNPSLSSERQDAARSMPAARSIPAAVSAGSAPPIEPGPATRGLPDREATGGTQVPSAWGNTQRGRHRSWQRRGIPLALLLGLVGVGAYWASNLTSSSRPSALPSERQISNAPGAAHGDSIAPAGMPPAVTSPEAAPAAQPLAPPEGTAERLAVEPGATADKPRQEEPPMTSGESTIRVVPAAASPQPIRVPADTAASAQRPAPAASNPAKANRAAPKAEPASAAAPEANRPQPRANEPAPGDKPTSEPSTRGAPDMPEFGGRD